MSSVLDPREIRRVCAECLCDVHYTKKIYVQGPEHRFTFAPGAISKHMRFLRLMMCALPEALHDDQGAGAPYLIARFDRFGTQWGTQFNAEQLLALASAAGLGSYDFDRPTRGGDAFYAPYFIIKTKELRDAS